MTPPRREQQMTRRAFALANRVRDGRFNARQLEYLDACLTHYHSAIKEMNDDQPQP